MLMFAIRDFRNIYAGTLMKVEGASYVGPRDDPIQCCGIQWRNCRRVANLETAPHEDKLMFQGKKHNIKNVVHMLEK